MLRRHPDNPLLTRADIRSNDERLTDVSAVFNPGASVFDGRILLLLRVQNRGRETTLLPAWSDDGVTFEVDSVPVVIEGRRPFEGEVYHIYDPRITRIEDRWLVTVAVDTDRGCRVALLETEDFRHLKWLALTFDEDTRNGVLLPVLIDNQYALLDRPNTRTPRGEPASGDLIRLSFSRDLTNWTPAGAVMRGRAHYWDELIGPGPPPILTEHGWLLIYHGVATHFGATNVYQAGVALLDSSNPGQVAARGRYNILEPRELYEQVGQVPNVVFPSGAVVVDRKPERAAPDSAVVDIYYGAADTVVAMASATVGELIDACRAGNE